MFAACVLSLPWTIGTMRDGTPRYADGVPAQGRVAPAFWPVRDAGEIARLNAMIPEETLREIGDRHGLAPEQVVRATSGRAGMELRGAWPSFSLGSDPLGRSLLIRLLAGGAISLTIGVAAALISVAIGTAYGMTAGYVGGRTDAFMMRVVDVLYGVPYILLVVLLAIASDAVIEDYLDRAPERRAWVEANAAEEARVRGITGAARDLLREDPGLARRLEAEASARFPLRPESDLPLGLGRRGLDLMVLLGAIASVSWLTTARVVRGQVMSLRSRAFVEAARALGASGPRIMVRHILPNLAGTIAVYTTLTVPQAILQESFLSFLGIGVKAPLPSWGNLAAEGLSELNPYRSHWWLLLFPCLLLAGTLLSLNVVGEALRESLDPRARRGGPR